MKISLCIPMYNEGGIIADTLYEVCDYMGANFEDWEAVFSDDGSTDNSRLTVHMYPNKHVCAVGYDKNKGKGAAIRNAVMSAEGDIIIFTDCDLAYGLEVVGQAAKIFEANPDTDIVIGSRNLSGDGYYGYTPIRKLASKVYIKCLAAAAGFDLSDSQCGFKAFRRDTAREIFSECEVDGFAFDFEVLIKARNMGKSITEMPVRVINHRESKVNVLRDSIKMLRDVREIKKRNPKK